MAENRTKAYLQLQLVVVIAAFTAVFGELISLPSYSLVIWRTGLAAIILGVWLKGRVIYFSRYPHWISTRRSLDDVFRRCKSS